MKTDKSKNFVSFTIAPIIGYRYKGLCAEMSIAYTGLAYGNYEDRPNTENLYGNWINVNPKILVGQKVFASFGPSFTLLKPKKPTDTLWDCTGRYNFELGYSELIRF